MSINMKDQKFGVEIEFYGLTRDNAARIVQSVISDEETPPYHTHEHGLDTFKFEDAKRRTWKIVSDASVNRTRGQSCELVTPPLRYEDVQTLQSVVRALNAAGARADVSCGIHIHIDGANHDARSIRNLSLICASKQDIMLKALEVPPERYTQWCQKADANFINFLKDNRNPSLQQIEDEYYRNYSYQSRSQHYNSSRYHLVNLHDYFNGHGTVEFRAFNGESKKRTKHLHAGEVKAYIDFCLAISAQAINNGRCRFSDFDHTNERYTYRTWLVGHKGLKLNGEEFKNTRQHLLGKLEGDNVYKDREAALEKKNKKLAESQLQELRPQVEDIMATVLDMPPEERTATLQQLQQLISIPRSAASTAVEAQSTETQQNNTPTNRRRGR